MNNPLNIVSTLIFLLIIILTQGCASTNQLQEKSTPAQTRITQAQDENFVILITSSEDTLKTLAEKYLGDKNKSWVIADFNGISQITEKREIVIPLKNINPTGVTTAGIQTIPILCYHRFGDGHTKLAVSEKQFKAQMQYLSDNQYHVIPLTDVARFIHEKKSLPKMSVVITIDDGYRSTFDIAYPILKSLQFPATLFLYTDFAGARDAINWKQARDMYNSGFIDIQPHSKSHPNMSLRKKQEAELEYIKRITREIDEPNNKIIKQVKNKIHTFAYPYGDTNKIIINHLIDKKYDLGVTVQAGSNSAFAHPYMLKRTMIFGDDTMQDFKRSLNIFHKMTLK